MAFKETRIIRGTKEEDNLAVLNISKENTKCLVMRIMNKFIKMAANKIKKKLVTKKWGMYCFPNCNKNSNLRQIKNDK